LPTQIQTILRIAIEVCPRPARGLSTQIQTLQSIAIIEQRKIVTNTVTVLKTVYIWMTITHSAVTQQVLTRKKGRIGNRLRMIFREPYWRVLMGVVGIYVMRCGMKET